MSRVVNSENFSSNFLSVNNENNKNNNDDSTVIANEAVNHNNSIVSNNNVHKGKSEGTGKEKNSTVRSVDFSEGNTFNKINADGVDAVENSVEKNEFMGDMSDLFAEAEKEFDFIHDPGTENISVTSGVDYANRLFAQEYPDLPQNNEAYMIRFSKNGVDSIDNQKKHTDASDDDLLESGEDYRIADSEEISRIDENLRKNAEKYAEKLAKQNIDNGLSNDNVFNLLNMPIMSDGSSDLNMSHFVDVSSSDLLNDASRNDTSSSANVLKKLQEHGVFTKRFGDLVPGDRVVSLNGDFVEVTKVHEEHIPEKMYHLEFDNGSWLDASGNHLFYVETEIDRGHHRQRIANAENILKTLDETSISDMLVLAQSDEHYKASVEDMMNMTNAYADGKVFEVYSRIAESLGHIEEENIIRQDLYDEREISRETVRLYDANLFAQQILSIRSKSFRKIWPVVCGRVVSTQELIEMSETMDVDIPEVRPVSEVKSKWWKVW